ncbi:uncharacterized protein LOC126737949 isoform X2 [Anthonomus grandis grandis]|uniref:uncharacterized protein LOC126737949 isoform X2 n=1 Tax=Anthonomus grandis grandis TaxID=2921223 RepID=UPI002166A885|nr:uncharacterized protein LOC126737949 isoform X2 [Anthonomus grandis grandis]
MKHLKSLLISLIIIFDFVLGFSGLSINGTSLDIEGGSPGPPEDTETDIKLISNNNILEGDDTKLMDICEFDGTFENVNNDLIRLRLSNSLFKSEEIVPGIKYQVYISRKAPGPPISLAIRTSVASMFQAATLDNNNCGSDIFNIQLRSDEAIFNWTLKVDVKRVEFNISFRINYKLDDNPSIHRAIFVYSIAPECRLYLQPESKTLSNVDLPRSADCWIWFPSPNDGHGLVVELMRLNVPCSKGHVHFSGTNQTAKFEHDYTSHKLCGKLEELPESDRNIYFPETSRSQPFMHVHGNPTFSVSYRLVDYCYNITFVNKEGSVELKPDGQLLCTFRIYMPHGNRIALKLRIGDSLAKDHIDTPLTLQDLKNGNIPCHGLLTQLYDADSHWSHCTKQGDEERQIDIVSKDNKIVLKVTRGAETSGGNLRLRISYKADPDPSVVGLCDFGWVAMRQFCITVVDNMKMQWAKAEGECVIRGGHLVSVRSERDQKIVDSLLVNSPGYRDSNAYWIGASDKTHESDFRWSDGLSFSFTNWFPGWPQHQHYNKQPNDDGLSEQDCVEVRRTYTLPTTSVKLAPGFMWNDRDCATPNYFICEKLQNDESLDDNWLPDCNHTLTLSRQTPRATISSPGFPRHYPDNADCDTNILAPSGYRIVLDFDELVIENEPNCSYDYLEIIENSSNGSIPQRNQSSSSVGRRLCGDWSTKLKLLRYVSHGSKLTLRFSSDYSHHFGGFKARVSMENAMQCGDERLHMFNEACYLVVNYPEVTWPTAQQICRGVKATLASIVTPEEGRFISTIIRKNAEYRTSALYWLGGKADPASDFKWIDGNSMEFQGWIPGYNEVEYSDVGDISPKKEIRCIGVQWTPSPTPVLPSGLYWRAQKCSKVGGYVCKRKRQLLDSGLDLNKTINSSEGTLTTPNYPENYYNNLDFLGRIIGPERTRLKIRFSRIDIESQPECLYDYVELRSVWKSGGKKLAEEDSVKFCGSHVTQMERFDFVSQTNEAEVRFHSDYSVTGSGFSLTWEAVDVSTCPTQTLTAREGVIMSPNYPYFLLAHLDCSIVIQAPPGKSIWLEFTDIDLGYNSSETINNREGRDVTFEMQLGKNSAPFKPFLINGLLTEGDFISLEERMIIRLQTGKNAKGKGFRALYHTIDESSMQEKNILLRNDTVGLLLNLNYPQQSPPNVDFIHRFIAPLGHFISVELYSVKLSHTECFDDNGLIEIFDSYSDRNGTVWKLCYDLISVDTDDSSSIFIKSFLNTMQIRQKSAAQGSHLNGTLKVLFDEEYKKKLISYNHNDVESCKPNPCQHGGKCINKKNKKVCQCTGHFTGLFCAITQCDLEPCVFGTCELTNTSYKCHCKTNYVGPTCEQKRKPCEGNPCESRGTCIEKGNGYYCRCHAWWEGAKCEKRMLHIPYKPLSERMLHEPFWLGLMTVFVVMGVIGLVWCAKRHFPEKIEKLLAEDDNRNRIHSLRSTSVREQLAAASGAATAAALTAAAASPGPAPGRSLFGRLGIRKPSILSLTSPHAGAGSSGGYSPATARTFSLDDLLKPPPRRTPSPKKKRNNSTPTKKNVAEKKQILQQLISPVNKHNSKRVSLGELIQMSEQKTSGIQSAPSVIVKETKFCDDPALTALNDPKLEKKVTFARLLNKVSAEMSSGSDMEMGIMQTNRLGCIFPRPSSTPPSPSVVNRSPNSTSSNQGSDSFTSSDLAIPSALSSSISDLLINRRQHKTSMGKQKPASADSILAMFRNFSSSSAGANLPSSLKLSPSTTPTASSPHDDIVGDDESSSSSIHTPVSFSSGAPESPILHHHVFNHQSTIEVPVLDPISAHRSASSGTNLLHPPTILLEIPSTINKCLSPIREMPTPLPSPMPSPAITPIMRRAPSPISRLSAGQISASSLDELENSDDKISIEIPNISVSASDDDEIRCPDIVIDPLAEDGLIFEEVAAMQHSALYKAKNRPPPLGQINIQNPPPPLVIPTLTIETPSPTRKTPTLLVPGSPPPQRGFPQHQDTFQFPFTAKSGRKMFKDFEKPTSLDLPTAPPLITITCNMSEAESDIESISPAVKLSAHHHGASGGMTYLSPFSMAHRGDQHASESNLSSSGYSSMASPGPSRCGSSNPLCPSEMEDQGPPGSGNHGFRRQSTPVLKPNSNSGNSDSKTSQGNQRRGRSDSETLSDDPLLESNDEGIGTDHIDEKIDEGEVKSAKELEVFMNDTTDKTVLLDLPLIPSLTTPKVAKCISIESSMDRLLLPLTTSNSKNSLQLPSIVVQLDAATGEKYLSPMSSRSESPLSDRTTGMGRFSPLFYGKNKDLLPFTDSDGLYDFPSSDKVNVTNPTQHKKVGRKREKRVRSSKTPSPTKQQQTPVWHNHLDVPNTKDPYYKVPPPRKFSPKRRLARTQVVSSSSSSDSIVSARELRHSSSSPSSDTVRWSPTVTWMDQKHPRSLDASCEEKNDSNPSSPMLSRSLEFTRKQPKYQKVSRLRAISNQIRFLRRLEQSLKRRDRTASPVTDTSESDEDSPMVTSPLLHQTKGPKVEIRKSNSIGKLQVNGGKTNKGTKFKQWDSLQEGVWPTEMHAKHGNSE